MCQESSPTSRGEKLKHVWEQMSNAIQRHHSYLVDIDKCWWIDRKYRGCCSCEDRRALHSSQKIPDKCLTCKNFKTSRVAPPKHSWCLNIKGWAGTQRRPKPGKWSPHNSESNECNVQLRRLQQNQLLTSGGSVCPEKLPRRGEERLKMSSLVYFEMNTVTVIF